MQSSYPRAVVLRKSIGPFSGGTRVDIVERDDDGMYVECHGQIFHVTDDDLVTLRQRTLPDLKRQRQLRVERVLGSAS